MTEDPKLFFSSFKSLLHDRESLTREMIQQHLKLPANSFSEKIGDHYRTEGQTLPGTQCICTLMFLANGAANGGPALHVLKSRLFRTVSELIPNFLIPILGQAEPRLSKNKKGQSFTYVSDGSNPRVMHVLFDLIDEGLILSGMIVEN